MKGKRFNNNTEIKRRIKEKAANLPPCDQYFTVNKRGHEIIADGITKVDGYGKIIPGQLYSVREKKPVNHYERMVVIFEKHGWAGVKKYEGEVWRIEFEYKHKVARAKYLALPFHRKLWHLIKRKAKWLLKKLTLTSYPSYRQSITGKDGSNPSSLS